MSKKLICFIAFVLVLGMAAASQAGLDDDPNLEGWWKFDGDTSDSSGHGRDGVLVDNATLVDTGLLGGAVMLDGSGNDYVTIPGYKGINADRTDPDNPFNPAFSIAVWVKTTDDTGALVTWGSGDGTGVGGQRQSFRINSGRLRAEHGNGNLQGATTVNDDEWHHIVQTTEPGAEGGALRPPDTLLYLDGVEETYQGGGSGNIFNLTEDADVRIGGDGAAGGRLLAAEFDDVRIYSRVLAANEVAELAIRPRSYKPSPGVGALVEDFSVLLSWTPGGYAVEHDVYFGTVSELGADQLLGRQAGTSVQVTDLQQDMTYYWRVDDVAADGTVITGEVWSFWVPPQIAYDPSPPDGQRILNNTVNLTWTAGWNPISHQVYFGTDHDQVANGANAPVLTSIGFDPGPLEWDTTYYWRVDEFYGTETVKGPVWTFNTPPVLPMTSDPNLVAEWTFDGDTGGAALDQSGHTNHVALRNGAQVIAGHGGDVLDLGEEGYGAIANLVYNSTGLTEVTASSWIRTDSEVGQFVVSFDRNEYYRLAVGATNSPVTDGQVGWHVWTDAGQLDYGSVTRVDDGNWHHIAGVFDNGIATIYIDGFAEPSMALGSTYGTGNTRYGLIGANSEATDFDGSNSGGPPILGEIDDLRIYDKAFSEDEMRQLYGNLALAWQPQPQKGAVGDIWTMATLSWTAGDGAVEHDVYLGTDPNAVAAADTSDTTGIYQGRQAETTHVSTVKLEFDQQYYWRIDEVAADGTVSTGNIWSFSTTDEVVLSDVDIPFPYDNSVEPFVSEYSMDLDPALDLSAPVARIGITYTGQAAPGSVTADDAAGTVTIVGRGNDIWGSADQFQFAYTMLTGDGSMTVKVESLANTHNWSKAGVMVRETLDPGSPYGFAFVSGTNGVRFEGRVMVDTDASGADSSVVTDEEKAVVAPVWLKIERTFPFINAFYSADGVTWTPMAWNPQLIPLSPAPVYIGLAVTSHSGDSTYAEGVFSNISSTGGVAAGPLTSAEIGDMPSNSAEPMYLMLEDASGASAAVLNPDPAAAQQGSPTEWVVELNQFPIDLTAVVKASLVLGNLDAPTPGGSGMLTINNVRLLPRLPVIVWVSDNKTPTDGIPADQAWVDLLSAQQYTIDLSFRNKEGRTIDETKVASLNEADLIIISRDTNSGDYANGDEETLWNSITTPIIMQVAHIARSNRWLWLNSGSTNNAQPTMQAVATTNPIFNGVTLNASGQVDVVTTDTSFVSITDVGNGTLIAARADNGEVWIAEWQTGQEFYAGAGQTAAGPRMLFCSGGTGNATDGAYNLTADGETMFLNAISLMISGGTP